MKPDSLASPTHAAPLLCLNCNAVVSGNFCQNCGQETHLHKASAREFLHEFVGHYVALEGRLWGTMGRLLFRPGALTNEYVAGRRVRFVQPLRLYLTLSILFFALLKLSNSVNIPVVDDAPAAVAGAAHTSEPASEPASKAPAATGPAKAATAGEAGPDDINIDNASIDAWFKRFPTLHHQWQLFEKLPAAEKSKVFSNGVHHFAPYAMFCLMPIFALYLKILFLGSGRRYGEHLLFALHTNAFAFVMFGAIMLANNGLLTFALWVWLLGYLPWAMRRVYQRSRAGTLWRWLLLMAVYSLTMGLGFVLTAGAGILSVGH